MTKIQLHSTLLMISFRMIRDTPHDYVILTYKESLLALCRSRDCAAVQSRDLSMSRLSGAVTPTRHTYGRKDIIYMIRVSEILMRANMCVRAT